MPILVLLIAYTVSFVRILFFFGGGGCLCYQSIKFGHLLTVLIILQNSQKASYQMDICYEATTQMISMIKHFLLKLNPCTNML